LLLSISLPIQSNLEMTMERAFDNLRDPFYPLVFNNVAELIGNTPLLRISSERAKGGASFWCKLEGYNLFSIKDRSAYYVIRKAREKGELKEGSLIVESSSGAMALGLALAGVVFHHPVVIVSDPGMEPLVRNLLTASGAKVEIVPEPHPELGWQGARLERLQQILAANSGAFWPCQYDNPLQVDSYEVLANELIRQVPKIDALVCSVGTGGHSHGIARRLKRVWPRMKSIAVDSIGSVIFGQPNRSRLIRGMGNSILPGNVNYDLFDEIHWVAPGEAVAACRELARTCFLSGGWSTGCVYLVGCWIASQMASDQVVVGIFPDRPERYWNSIFDENYCKEHCLTMDSCNLPDSPQTITDPSEPINGWTRCLKVLNQSERRDPNDKTFL
jgi:cysteine synthase